MPRVKSAKGKVIDFDRLKIQRQLANKPISIDVKARQNFIDQKARRRLRKATVASVGVDSAALTEVVPSEAKPIVDAPAPQVVDVTQKSQNEEKHSKQKVRPPKTE